MKDGKNIYATEESAKAHYGKKCAVMECWHWCPNCGTYWCHFIDAKASMDKFARICFSNSATCLQVPRPTDREARCPRVMRANGRVYRADNTPSVLLH